MRIVSAAGLACLLFALAGCEDSTGPSDRVLRLTGQLDENGDAYEILPREAGNMGNLPSLTCYVRNPDAQFEADRAWFAFSSSTADGSACLLEAATSNGSQLAAVIEGEQPFAQYQFVVVY